MSKAAERWSVDDPATGNSFLFIPLKKGAYVRPHRHPGSQFMIVLTGKIRMLLFHAKSGKHKTIEATANGKPRAIHVPAGTFHSCVALTKNVLLLEIVPMGIKKEYLRGSPLPGTPEAKALVRLWTKSRVTAA